jgi:uncharacterized protein YbjT (DUF2867 family)
MLENQSHVRAIIVGGTGSIGQQLLIKLSNHDKLQEVISIQRKPSVEKINKVKTILTDFNDLMLIENYFENADCLFCSLGTTIHKAGTREKFLEVDLELPLKIIKLFKSKGGKKVFLVTAMGANKKSYFFYNQVKGLLEEECRKISSSHFIITIFRPSLLKANRKEKRVLEEISQKFFGCFNFLIPKFYQMIDVKKVAELMVKAMDGETVNNDINCEVLS